jgi:hypothetical protein
MFVGREFASGVDDYRDIRWRARFANLYDSTHRPHRSPILTDLRDRHDDCPRGCLATRDPIAAVLLKHSVTPIRSVVLATHAHGGGEPARSAFGWSLRRPLATQFL